MKQCVECKKESAEDTWQKGECCIVGSIYACSRACAEKWALRELNLAHIKRRYGTWEGCIDEQD